jgi:hypothetical protein
MRVRDERACAPGQGGTPDGLDVSRVGKKIPTLAAGFFVEAI